LVIVSVVFFTLWVDLLVGILSGLLVYFVFKKACNLYIAK